MVASSTTASPMTQTVLWTSIGNWRSMWKLLRRRAKKVGDCTKVL